LSAGSRHSSSRISTIPTAIRIHTFFLLPLTRLLGATVTYNLAGWGSTVLSGWVAYRLARRWLADLASTPLMLHGAAFFAGTAFAFTPYRLLRLESQLPLIGTGWLALALLAVDRWVAARRWQDALLLGAAVGLASLSSWYYAYILALLLPVFVLVRAGNLRAFITAWRTWLTVALAAGITATLVTPFLIPYLRLSAAGEAVVPLSDASFWVASPFDYFLPSLFHPLWGRRLMALLWPEPGDWLYEFAMSPGWVTLILGLWAWRQMRGGEWRALKWMMAGAFVLSLGPFLHLGRVPLPVPLPALALRAVLPGADAIRSWDRFSILVILGMALLGAAGLVLAVRTRSARRQALVLSLALVGLLFEFWPGPRTLTATAPRPVDEWLAAQPDAEPIMQYPLFEGLSGPAMFYTPFTSIR